MIDFMNFWVNELFGNPLLALLGIEFVYAVIMFLGRISIPVMVPVLALTFVIFSGLLWGSWITVFLIIGSMIYLGYAILKFIGPPQ
jgi:hypothetical protein